jgi:hypothetical protein
MNFALARRRAMANGGAQKNLSASFESPNKCSFELGNKEQQSCGG